MTCGPIINIAVLGAASIALRSVIPAINALPNRFNLSGISSRDSSKAKTISSSYECKAYGTYESLLNDCTIDAVYIPLPNALHHPFVKMALENGKHILVEKSLGCTLDEVEELVEIAKANNLVLFENFQFRFHSQLSTILQIIKDGTIGDLRSMKVAFGFPPFLDPNNIRYSAKLGGGALLDAGASAMNIAPFFLGNDIFVAQASSALDQSKGVDIWGGGVVQQRDGPLFCHFSYGFDHHYQCSLELWGSIGKLTTNRIFTAPVGYNPKLIVETQNVVEERSLSADDQFKNMLEHLYSLITGSESVLMEYEQNVQQANLIHEFKQLSERF